MRSAVSYDVTLTIKHMHACYINPHDMYMDALACLVVLPRFKTLDCTDAACWSVSRGPTHALN